MSTLKALDLPAFRTVWEAVKVLSHRFSEACFETPELDASLIVRNACGLSHEAYFLNSGRRLSSNEADAIEHGSNRRLLREPVSRIIGKREFWGQEFRVSPFVLDPRPDTETLVEVALNILKEEGRLHTGLRILDLGTGSGCILLTLLAESPNAWGVGTDIDHSALRTAQENARRLNLLARTAFTCGNWCDPLSGPFDLIVSNPPYIRSKDISGLSAEVRCYDPMIALDGGLDGLDAYRHIALSVMPVAREGAWIVLEAAMGQADEIIQLFRNSGWISSIQSACLHRDLAGINRVVAIKRQSEPR